MNEALGFIIRWMLAIGLVVAVIAVGAVVAIVKYS